MVEQSVRKRTLELQQGSGDDEQSDYEKRAKESGLSWRKFLCSKILNSDCNVIRDNPWLLELGYDIRDDAVKDVLTATKGQHDQAVQG